jgi:hypothetical protein
MSNSGEGGVGRSFRWRIRSFAVASTDLLLAAVGVLGVVVSVRSLMDPVKDFKGLNGALALLLTSVGLLLVTTAIERRLRLDAITEHLVVIERGLRPNVAYLPGADAVKASLIGLVSGAAEGVYTLGARSSATRYLRAIEKAVTDRHLPYYRVLDGDDISHDLHEHLSCFSKRINAVYMWPRRVKRSTET